MAKNRSILASGLISLLHVYRWLACAVRPVPCCRFSPTCSAYAEEALKTLGFVTSVWLVTKRLLKCHPWHPGGFDPVPKQRIERNHG